MEKAHFTWKEILLVIFTAGLATVLTTTRFFAQLFRRPPDHVFIGMSHYFEDFYYYLDQFYQGAHGGWLTQNNFTPEQLPPTLIYFVHIILGKVGGFLGLESYTSYNMSLLIFKLIFMLLGYLFLRGIFPNNARYRFFAFLIFLFSTALPFGYIDEKGEAILNPRRIWGAENLMTTRFGNIPYEHVNNILFLLSLFIIGSLLSYLLDYFNNYEKNKERPKFPISKVAGYLLPMTLLLVFLTISDSAIALLLVLSSVLMMVLNRPKHKAREYFLASGLIGIVMLVSFVLAGFYLLQTINADPVYRKAVDWDTEQYFKQFTLLKPADWLFSFIPLGLSVALGLPAYFKKKKRIFEQFAGVLLMLSIAGYFSPFIISIRFPGARFIFASTYLFAAVIGLYGLLAIEKFLRLKILTVLMIIYLLVNLNTFRLSFLEEIKPLNEPNYHFAYIPDKLYQGLLFLRSQKPKNAIVLANSYTGMDLLIPGLTGKKTYSGHFLTTFNSAEKDKLSYSFFYERKEKEKSLNFLKSNQIEYLMFTKYGGKVEELKKDYNFLKVIFENDLVAIFTY